MEPRKEFTLKDFGLPNPARAPWHNFPAFLRRFVFGWPKWSNVLSGESTGFERESWHEFYHPNRAESNYKNYGSIPEHLRLESMIDEKPFGVELSSNYYRLPCGLLKLNLVLKLCGCMAVWLIQSDGALPAGEVRTAACGRRSGSSGRIPAAPWTPSLDRSAVLSAGPNEPGE